MGKIVTMGEIMLRLSTPGQTRFVQTDTFDINYGGGEANVAVSCANYGHNAYFVSKLPKHEIGQAAVNALRRYGVNTDYITRGGNRVGIYYLETGASMRPSKVIYDRAGSAIAEARPEDFDFDAIMEEIGFYVIDKKDWSAELKYHAYPEDVFYALDKVLFAISPFIQQGSYLEFSDNKGNLRRYIFNGEEMRRVEPQIIWPAITAEQYAAV